ncbi:hypothetical protein ABFS82_10G130000 [Erythranthe guttata]|uniref:pentatricopeptide repeat-containing protein At1g05600 n=1 Tax=Erythranthe guttata TaxID=4155 RepID=UPI00064E0D01|nr:PREDICTED: pentatricopeptide repeat-containing protein At1g05600 [Erythranthe guttata]|eukprot:XP_012837839.1 PREDICTED: pentatricopeptide repeat-containing protein At1g05600 [Erythranthe guttata]
MSVVRWPRLFLTPTQLSQLILSQKNPLKALDIFNEAKTRYPNYRHNGPVYATMIRILGSSGRITEMKEVVDRMKDDSCECKDYVFANLIRTYANAGLFDEAVSLFHTLPEFNCVNWTESFNTLLEIMVKDSKLESAYHFFVENCHGWEIKSRIRSLNLLMSALCRINRSDLALQVFQEMDYQWCCADRESYKILMKGLCEDRRLTEATHLLYSMFWKISRKGCGADVSIYRTLLEALCDNGEVEEATEVLEKVLRKGLKAPRKFRKKIDLSQFYHKDEAGIYQTKALINEALIKGGVSGSDGYRAMAVDLYSEGRIDEGGKVLDEMLQRGFRPSLPIYEAKVAALFKVGKIDEVVCVVEREMIENNCVPSLRLHNVVIKGLCEKRELNRAMEYFEKMFRQIGCVPDKETYSYLVDGLCCDGKYMEASGMLEKMVINSFWPGGEVYGRVIRGLCLIGNTFKAVLWLEEMISQGKIPDTSVWCSLVSSVCCDEILSLNFE